MEDKSSHQMDNKDRDLVSEAGNIDSEILENGLDYDIKERTQQSCEVYILAKIF